MTKTLRYATILALTAAVISGSNNFLTKIAVTAVKDPIVFTALKNAVVAAFLIGIILILGRLKEIISLNRSQALKLVVIGIIGGSIPFALFFTGLTMTTALGAGLIHKTLFLWVALLAIPILKEKVSAPQWLAIGAIFAANLMIGGFTGFKFNIGELMVLAATILWAVENLIAKIALKDISSLTLAGARMTLGSLILLGMVFWRGGETAIFTLTFEQWGWTLLTSLFLAGYVLTWYTALKYAPATYVATLLVPATLVTNILSAIFITGAFTLAHGVGAVLFVSGLTIFILFARQTIKAGAAKKELASGIAL